jgi:hypothetical protein
MTRSGRGGPSVQLQQIAEARDTRSQSSRV